MLLKRVLGASEAPFRACTQYIHTCKLPSSIGDFRSKKSVSVRDPKSVGESGQVRMCHFQVADK